MVDARGSGRIWNRIELLVIVAMALHIGDRGVHFVGCIIFDRVRVGRLEYLGVERRHRLFLFLFLGCWRHCCLIGVGKWLLANFLIIGLGVMIDYCWLVVLLHFLFLLLIN